MKRLVANPNMVNSLYNYLNNESFSDSKYTNFVEELLGKTSDEKTEYCKNNFEQLINLSGFAQSNNLSESSCKELAEEFINSTYCNKILNKYKKFFESFGISNPKELLNKKDVVGEETEINRDFDIEYTGRDYPFVYVNGSIILGNKGTDTHSQLLNKYMEETGNDFTGNEKLAFGQVAQGICFIETLENCNQEEVINALRKKKSDIKKVYDYDWQNKEVKRVARRKGKMCK